MDLLSYTAFNKVYPCIRLPGVPVFLLALPFEVLLPRGCPTEPRILRGLAVTDAAQLLCVASSFSQRQSPLIVKLLARRAVFSG